MTSARSHLAWLMWCYREGYIDPEDRDILRNWMDDPDEKLTPEDRATRRGLLEMADEVLDLVNPTPAGDPALWSKVHGMLTASKPPTLELGVAFTGGRYAQIVAASAGRGKPREKFTVVAPTLEQLFGALAAAVRSRSSRDAAGHFCGQDAETGELVTTPEDQVGYCGPECAHCVGHENYQVQGGVWVCAADYEYEEH